MRPSVAASKKLAATQVEVLHPGHFFGSRYREGGTGFRLGDPVFEALRRLSAQVPLVLAVGMDRPADLSRVTPLAAAIVATFGLSTDALLDVLLGLPGPTARLPYDLPWAGEGGPPPDMAVRLGEGLRY
jgi:beta-glucosidase